jgi:hypothetical protein
VLTARIPQLQLDEALVIRGHTSIRRSIACAFPGGRRAGLQRQRGAGISVMHATISTQYLGADEAYIVRASELVLSQIWPTDPPGEHHVVPSREFLPPSIIGQRSQSPASGHSCSGGSRAAVAPRPTIFSAASMTNLHVACGKERCTCSATAW